MALIYLALAWGAGIVIANHQSPSQWIILGLLSLGSVGVWLYQRDAQGRLFFICLMAFSLGMARFELANPIHDDSHLQRLNDQGNLTLTGQVIAEPELLDQELRIQVEVEQAGGHSVHGKLLATVPRHSNVHYGDQVRLQGFLVTPPELDDFSYGDYLARQGIFSAMFNAEVDITAQEGGFGPYKTMLEFKTKGREAIQQALPEPEASLLVGILLGDDNSIPKDTESAFTRTGASHLIAISGFNMAILAQVVMAFLSRLMGKQKAALPALATIFLYTLLVGASGSVVRAAIMSSLLIIAQTQHRRVFVPTSLAFCVLAMSLYDPWVLWDVGFQLSLAAVLGMAVLVQPMTRWVQVRLEAWTTSQTAQKGIGLVSDSLITSIAAQVTTTPLIAYYFGRVSLVAIPVNLLTLPVQAPILMLGGIGTVVSLLVPPFGGVILDITWVLLAWMVAVVDYFARLGWADMNLQFASLWVIGFFILLGGVVWGRAVRPKWLESLWQRPQLPAYGLQLAGIVLIAVMVNRGLDRPDQHLHLTFLDVGEAEGVLIETPNGGVILIDGGNQPSRLLAQLGQQLPANTSRIDVLIITIPQEDNIAALAEVVERYQVGVLLTNGQDSNDAVYQNLLTLAEEQSIPIVSVTTGYTLHTDDRLQIEVLTPIAIPNKDTDANLSSITLRVTYDQAVFLLTGQADSALEPLLLANPHLIQATVLQVPAHASHDSMSQPFLEAINPQVAVIHLDSDSQPNATQMSRLGASQLFRTDHDGAIEVITDGKTLWIKTHP